ncbi:MAG: amidohydrolase family protein [Gemmatimonadota bacterium]|nr:amidohydrolase family protein [Gemmatimonadota bacterium]
MRRILPALLLFAPVTAAAQTSQASSPSRMGIAFDEYDPRSMLKVPEHKPTRAKYPFVSVHEHPRIDMPADQLDALVRRMDALNMRVAVNLSGRQGELLANGVRNYNGRHPGRFVVFANVDFRGIDAPDWGERAAAQLERDVNEGGAKGLKIFKNLGMDVKDAKGERVRVDDPRIDPVWRKAGELGIPVLIHTGEPPAFFQPVDRTNERLLELTQFPDRARPPDRYPTFEHLMTEQHNMFRKHPRTKFINAHLGWLGADLGRLGALMDSLPNMYTELGAVLYELGRQPRFARQFFIKYQDRILMGKDITQDPSEYHVYFRVLETADEYFDYYRKRHAFWKMYGLDLPDDVLQKVYYKNALRVIPGIDGSAFPK